MLSYAQNKQRFEKERLLGIDTCPSLNDIMEIRCIKCNRSEQVYDFKSFGVSCLVDN
jgi:ribosomal protein S27E